MQGSLEAQQKLIQTLIGIVLRNEKKSKDMMTKSDSDR